MFSFEAPLQSPFLSTTRANAVTTCCECRSQVDLGFSLAVAKAGRKATQLAPLSLHDMLQVMVLPSRQALQAATHWLMSRALYLGKRSAMHTRCSSVYSGSLEHEARTVAAAIKT
jgi:hypothetical protein